MDFPGNTVGDFLHALEERYGHPMSSLLHPKGGELSDLMYILVNGKNIRHLDGEGTELQDGDTVSVLPVTAGG